MSNPEKDQAARLERARQIGLFRYMLIREAADATLTGRQRGALVRKLAAEAHTDPDGRTVADHPVDAGPLDSELP
jgi:putative transposase